MRQRSLARRTSSASVASAGRLASQYFAGSAAPSGHWQSSQASGSAARWARRRPTLAGRTRSARKRALMGPREPSRQATSRTFFNPVSYTHLRAHETRHDLVCRLLLEKKKKKKIRYTCRIIKQEKNQERREKKTKK